LELQHIVFGCWNFSTLYLVVGTSAHCIWLLELQHIVFGCWNFSTLYLVVGTSAHCIFHGVWFDVAPNFLGRFISCDLCISEVTSLKLLY